jgi:hypothetical protein
MALAAAQLVERLRRVRIRAARNSAALERKRRRRAERALPLRLEATLPLRVGAVAGYWTEGATSLFGPSLGVALAPRAAPRLELTLNQLAGFGAPSATQLSVYEAQVGAGYTFGVSRHSLDVGAALTTSWIHMDGLGPELSSSRDASALTSRLSLLLRYRVPLAANLALTVGTEVGAQIEPVLVPVVPSERVGGAFVGLQVALEIPLLQKAVPREKSAVTSAGGRR